eukprot:gnl/Chilomastix_caulleri/24.p1 GENE.gnl/Chilomastix_caulleri/24~~gnl/Chilomastix_caulleri/24.p1  ORF type:complete len:161 (-),score=58.30 gnl/Chilomastix_caulleri/24:65-547(-)
MLIYSCKISGDEMFSDGFPVTEKDGIILEIPSKNIYLKYGEQVNNEEDIDDECEKAIDVVNAFGLIPIELDKKKYQAYCGAHIKKILSILESDGTSAEDIEAFKTKGKNFIMNVSKNIDQYEFYMGKSAQFDGAIGFAHWGDGETPTFQFIKVCFKSEKV